MTGYLASEFDGNIKRIIHHINNLQGVHHLTIECTTPDQASELVALKDLRDDFEIGFGASLRAARDARPASASVC